MIATELCWAISGIESESRLEVASELLCVAGWVAGGRFEPGAFVPRESLGCLALLRLDRRRGLGVRYANDLFEGMRESSGPTRFPQFGGVLQ
jgi:hypothetical protein